MAAESTAANRKTTHRATPVPHTSLHAIWLGVAALAGVAAQPTSVLAQAVSRCGTGISGSFPTGIVCAPASGTAVIDVSAGSEFASTSGSSIRATARSADATVTVNSSSITNSSTTANANGVQTQVLGGLANSSVTFAGGTTNINLNGTLALDGASATNNTLGSATITVTTGTTVNITNSVSGNDHDGMDANGTGGGDASVVHNGAGRILAVGGDGVRARTIGAGNASIQVGSGVAITVDNTNGVEDPSDPGVEAGPANHAGVHAKNTGTGAITIDSAANIRSIAENAFGIFSESASGSATIRNYGAIVTDGKAGSAIRVSSTNGGDVTVVNNGTITTTGPIGHGIYAVGSTAGGDIDIQNNATMTVGSTANVGAADGSRGIYVISRGTGYARVTGTGDINVIGALSTGRAYGIIMTSEDGAAMVDYSGAITASGDGAGAIRAHSNTNQVSVNYTGSKLETFNANANGIYATNNSPTQSVSITATGTIITHSDVGTGDGSGSGSFGLQATSGGGPVSVDFRGTKIDVNGSGAGIVAGSAFSGGTGAGAVTINNAGAIFARGNSQRGIRGYSATGAQQITNNGPVRTSGATTSQGILAQATANAPLIITNNGAITTIGTNSSAIEATTQGTVDVSSTQPISAGWGTSAGILVGGATQTVRNTSSMTALSDVAMQADSGASGSLNLQNLGQMTGVVTASSSASQITNAGTWNLRSFIDSTGSGTRDTWNVAIANLGTSGSNTIDNTGLLSLSAQPAGTSAVKAPAAAIGTFNPAGAYLPLGQAANAPTLGGAVQGQLLGVTTFNNAGIIDVTGGGGAVGNVLVISGGQTAGANGGGIFVSNGGALKLNTVLNEGGANSRSDMLVVDSTSTGPNGATRVSVNNVGGTGTLTQGAGIAVVEVTNKTPAASDPNAFALNGRAVAGAYEYRLFRGDQRGGNTDVWYLRSEETPVPPAPPDPPAPLYRPEVAAYLANQRLAGQMFVHSLHDRLGEPQYVEEQGFDRAEEKPRSGWLRVVGKWEGSRSADGVFKTSTDSFLLHGGAELAKWKLFRDDGADRGHLGVMGSYGYASTDANARGNQFSAKGKVEGWSIGAYGTWYQNDEQKLGAYVDTWFQYGWFSNRVEGQLLPTVRYNATGWAISGETGYAIPTRSHWIIEPQGQLIYVGYNEDDITEPNGTHVNGANSHGWISRWGVRFHRTYVREEGKTTWQPYMTLNWWHTGVSSNISFNELPLGSMYPSNRYEVKIGTNAQFNKRWTGWTNVSGAWGAQSFYQYALRVGVKYTW